MVRARGRSASGSPWGLWKGQGWGDRAAWPAFWEGLAGVKGVRGGVQQTGQAGLGSGFVPSMAKGEGAAVRFPPVVGGLEARVWGWHWEVAGVREV